MQGLEEAEAEEEVALSEKSKMAPRRALGLQSGPPPMAAWRRRRLWMQRHPPNAADQEQQQWRA
jgi:hypothetical protein